jgi:hypothetical protein
MMYDPSVLQVRLVLPREYAVTSPYEFPLERCFLQNFLPYMN